MTKGKTIREWLEALPGGYRERALRNLTQIHPEFGNIDICETFPSAIRRAFVWEKTPEEEGYEFWSAVEDWAEFTVNLPPLPEEEK